MKNNKRFPVFLLIVLMLLQTSCAYASTDGFSTSYTYNYDYWNEICPSPDAYRVATVITSSSLGLETAIRRPQSLYVCGDELYLVDTGNNRILQILRDGDGFTLLRIIDSFSGHENNTFNTPQDVFVTESGDIYIADTNNNRVLLLDRDLNFVREYLKPTDAVFDQSQSFLPYKVVTDHAGRVYVLATNINKGLVKFEKSGKFVGFIGASPVTTSLAEYIWKYYFLTEDQQAQTEAFVPTEYDNICMDSRGFIYAVTNTFEVGNLLNDSAKPIRKLNGLGNDILIKNDKYPPVGDLVWNESPGPSRFVDIAVLDNGVYVAFDKTRGRLFGYDTQGIMLWAFGTQGNYDGAFTGPVSIEHMGNDLLCLDQFENSVTVFTPTEYGNLIYDAYNQYDRGDYSGSAETWQRVLQMNANYTPVFIGIGRSLLRQEKYEEAMDCFETAHDKENYGRAFRFFRKEWVEDNIGWIVVLFILILITPIAIKIRGRIKKEIDSVRPESQSALSRKKQGFKWAKSKYAESMKYTFHVLFHPFDGFWDLVHEKRGSIAAATTWLVLFLATYIFKMMYTNFQFVDSPVQYINVAERIAALLLPFLILCFGNWSMTTLFDGKGRFPDIYMAMCYALVPYVLIMIPTTLLSHALAFDEASLYYVFNVIAIVWCLFLAFVGLMEVHDYKPGKTIIFLIMTIFAAAVIIFLLLIIFSMLNDLINYVIALYKEYVYRIG